jgi:hypothetical protein
MRPDRQGEGTRRGRGHLPSQRTLGLKLVQETSFGVQHDRTGRLTGKDRFAKVHLLRTAAPLSRRRLLAADNFGQVAQLVEHRTENPGVGGSIPPLSTWEPRDDCTPAVFSGFLLALLRRIARRRGTRLHRMLQRAARVFFRRSLVVGIHYPLVVLLCDQVGVARPFADDVHREGRGQFRRPCCPQIVEQRLPRLQAGTLNGPQELRSQIGVRLAVSVMTYSLPCTRVKSPDEIVSQAQRAMNLFGLGRVLLSPDCGLTPFADSPIASIQTAEAKFASHAKAALVLRRLPSSRLKCSDHRLTRTDQVGRCCSF